MTLTRRNGKTRALRFSTEVPRVLGGWQRWIARATPGWLVVLCLAGAPAHGQTDPIDALFSDLRTQLGVKPNQAEQTITKLEALREHFTPAQNARFMLVKASSLGFKGLHAERVALVQSFLPQVTAPRSRVRFLYELIDGLAVMGRYEEALLAMNESVGLIPQLEKTSEKIVAMQSAISLLASLRAFDEALDFANRMEALRDNDTATYAECAGLTNKVELHLMRGDSAAVRAQLPDAIQACENNKNALLTLINRTNAVVDLVNSGTYAKGLAAGLPLLDDFVALSAESDYITQLQEALARAYLATGQPERAEHFGLQAFQRAQASHVLLLQEKTSETMAAIKRAQGQLAAAIGYYDANLARKKKGLDDQIQKKLAYQHVKFDIQDKANQQALLEQKNRSLGMEKALRERQTENLILLLTLGLIVLAGMGTWLVRALRKTDGFRHSAQVDMLTQVNNRAYFTASTQQTFKDTSQTISLVLFDMDLFKHINDSYGHATGDWVLKTVCDAVRAHLRKSDLFGRLGGEEFALSLGGLNAEEALILAERCRVAILAIDTRPTSHAFTVTASFGIATRTIGGNTTYQELLAAADKALYISKHNGRNRVSVYHPSAAAPAAYNEHGHH